MPNFKHIFRQTIRGCKNLPYVGSHDGISVLIIFIFMGGLAGASSKKSALFGMAVAGALLLPIMLWGAYSRAELSDKLVQENSKKS